MPADEQAALPLRMPRNGDPKAGLRAGLPAGLLEALLAEAPVPLAVWGTDGRFLQVNRAFGQLSARAVTEHVGLTCEDVLGDAAPAYAGSSTRSSRAEPPATGSS